MKVIMDPKEARRFAAFLDDRGGDLREINRRASLHIMELGMNGWEDSRYQDFLRQFDEASTLLQVFSWNMRTSMPTTCAGRRLLIERYLGHR